MSTKQRERIRDYLYAGFTASGAFSCISVGRTPLEGYSSPESGRFLSLWRDDGERYLVIVHADQGYKPQLGHLSALMRDMSKERVACVSVFDDALFLNLDANEEERPKAARIGGRKGRIKLLGLERSIQNLGPVTYYRNNKPRLEEIQFTSGVIGDYSRSERVPKWLAQQRELLTIVEPKMVGTYESPFDLSPATNVMGMCLTGFTALVERVNSAHKLLDEFLQLTQEEEIPLDPRRQFVRDELEGGRDPEDIPELGR